MGALGPITVAIVSITLTWAGHLRSRVGIKAVGHIDAGLPPFTVWHSAMIRLTQTHGIWHELQVLLLLTVCPIQTLKPVIGTKIYPHVIGGKGYGYGRTSQA